MSSYMETYYVPVKIPGQGYVQMPIQSTSGNSARLQAEMIYGKENVAGDGYK